MTRIATVEDIPALVEMGREFHVKAPHGFLGKYDDKAVERVLRFLMMRDGGGFVLWSDDGFIGGLLMPVFFDPTRMVFEVQFWTSRKYGRSLLADCETEARLRGASATYLSIFEGPRTAAADRAMKRMGYAPTERRYMRELSQ